MSDPGPNTIATLPPGSEGCRGVSRIGDLNDWGRRNDLCLGCLRYRQVGQADRRMKPEPIAQPNGTYYCPKRIGA